LPHSIEVNRGRALDLWWRQEFIDALEVFVKHAHAPELQDAAVDIDGPVIACAYRPSSVPRGWFVAEQFTHGLHDRWRHIGKLLSDFGVRDRHCVELERRGWCNQPTLDQVAQHANELVRHL